VLKIDIPGAKRPSYSIVYNSEDISPFFSDIEVREEDGKFYLNGIYKGVTVVHERLMPLDATRLQKGDIPMAAILSKYCSYLLMK
jgi:hypothetical protein